MYRLVRLVQLKVKNFWFSFCSSDKYSISAQKRSVTCSVFLNEFLQEVTWKSCINILSPLRGSQLFLHVGFFIVFIFLRDILFSLF